MVSLYRLQDFDNGYFEKFGSLLQRKIQDVDQNIATPAFDIASKQVTDSVSLRTIEEAENDSGTETLHDTDSEPDDQLSKQEDLIEEFTGLNVSIISVIFALATICSQCFCCGVLASFVKYTQFAHMKIQKTLNRIYFCHILSENQLCTYLHQHIYYIKQHIH